MLVLLSKEDLGYGSTSAVLIEATVLKWFAQEGDLISKGQPLVGLASDVRDSILLAPVTGRVLKHFAIEGDVVTINWAICELEAFVEVEYAAPPAKIHHTVHFINGNSVPFPDHCELCHTRVRFPPAVAHLGHPNDLLYITSLEGHQKVHLLEPNNDQVEYHPCRVVADSLSLLPESNEVQNPPTCSAVWDPLLRWI